MFSEVVLPGFNITIPYKEKIIPYLDEIDGAVSACGAVNTVEIRDGRMIGHITDGLGMLRAIEEQRDYHQRQADVLILGRRRRSPRCGI